MPVVSEPDSLQDVQVCGQWNFTLQADTPIYWLRSGAMEFYLLRFRAHTLRPSTWGIVVHGEADGEGTDGVTFYVERRLAFGKKAAAAGEGFKRYVMTGDGLDSKPIVSKQIPDRGGEAVEDFEVLMQGYNGVLWIQNRTMQMKFKTRRGKGSVGFFNTTRADDDNIHFSQVWLTAVRRGPMECDGILGRRVKHFETPPRPTVDEEEEAASMEYGEPVLVDQAGEGAATTGLESMEDTLRDYGENPPVITEYPGGTTSPTRGTPSPEEPEMTARGGGTGRLAGSSKQAQASQTFSGAEGVRSPFNGTRRRGAGTLQTSPKLRASASEGVLRRTGGFSSNASATARSGSLSGTKKSGNWHAYASNFPAREQQFMKDVFWRELSRKKPGACEDFIPM